MSRIVWARPTTPPWLDQLASAHAAGRLDFEAIGHGAELDASTPAAVATTSVIAAVNVLLPDATGPFAEMLRERRLHHVDLLLSLRRGTVTP